MKISRSIEILAPAGGKEQLTAAVRCGADAVYLGTKSYNARQNAKNFDTATGELSEAVSYCHARNVSVHVTMNTLLSDSELGGATQLMSEVAQSGADAFIVQDMAVANLVRKLCPETQLHASTQMAVHNLSGVKALEDMGFHRAVLARELSISEIEYIAARTNIELEVFIHGALCMSASGLCGLSHVMGGRSANRGMCAQPCRLEFRHGSREHALSLKDMSHIKYLGELNALGISAAKIEGRMKRPEYVAAAVTACRAVLNGEEPDTESLRAVFSRGGFTEGYAESKRDLHMYGHRGKEDVLAAEGVYGKLHALYKNELQRVNVDLNFRLKEGKNAKLSATDGTYSVSTEGAMPELAQKRAFTSEDALRYLQRTGGTPFKLHELDCYIDDNLSLPASSLNEMRRTVLSDLLTLREERREKAYVTPLEHDFVSKKHETRTPEGLRVRFERAEQMFDAPKAELIILPIAEIERSPALLETYGAKLAAELPSLTYPKDEQGLYARLKSLMAKGLCAVSLENLAYIKEAKDLGLAVHGGLGLNVYNSGTIEEYATLGVTDCLLSSELSPAQVSHMCGVTERGVIGYGHLPVMKLRNCPAQSVDGCGKCKGVSSLTDRKGERFTLLCRDKRYTELLNCVAVYVGDKERRGVDFSLLYFTTEDKATCESIYELYRKGEAPTFRRRYK